MHLEMKQLLLSLATLIICVSSNSAATYIEPNLEGKILVKIDQVPLDSGTMRWVANYMTELAEQQAGSDDAIELMAGAKLVALAQQLDKSLPQIPAANLKLQQGKMSEENDTPAKHKQNRLRMILEYLTSEESSPEGKLLAQLTSDALSAIGLDELPMINSTLPENLWQGSIADHAKFEESSEPILISNERITHTETEPFQELDIDESPTIPEFDEQLPKTKWKLSKLAVTAPITTYEASEERTQRTTTGLLNFTLEIAPLVNKGHRPYLFRSKPRNNRSDYMARTARDSMEIIRLQWESFPRAIFTVHLTNPYSYSSDHQLTSSALTLAFDAALRGIPLRKNLLVISSINEEAKFRRNHNFWKTLIFLNKEARDSRILVVLLS